MLGKSRLAAATTRIGAWAGLVTMPLLGWACVRLSVDLASQWTPSWLIEDALLLTAATFAAFIATYLSALAAAIVASSAAGARGWAIAVGRLAPHSWRSVVSLAVGVGFATGVAAPSLAVDDGAAVDTVAVDSVAVNGVAVPPQIAWVAPDAAAAAPIEASPAAVTPSAAMPTTTPEVSTDVAPTDVVPTTAAPTYTAPASAAHTYTIERGDSLWDITAALLGTAATVSDIALAWPELYAANRAVVGADPGLIFAGQVLVVPESIS